MAAVIALQLAALFAFVSLAGSGIVRLADWLEARGGR